MYRQAKRDANERKIIRFLERCGASVAQLDDPAVPDLLIGFGSVTQLAEIKSEKGKLTPAQQKFFKSWKGQKAVVRSIHDAKELLRNIGMPVYTYKCKNCLEETVMVHSMFEEPKKLCPKCQQEELVRLIVFAPVVIFKGNGWGKDTVAKP